MKEDLFLKSVINISTKIVDINNWKNSYKYKVSKETLRNKTIDMLFDTNKK